jgi:hypothetical protein
MPELTVPTRPAPALAIEALSYAYPHASYPVRGGGVPSWGGVSPG